MCIRDRWGRFAVARGAAMFATRAPEAFTLAALREKLATAKVVSGAQTLPPLFADKAEYAAFAARHARASVPRAELSTYRGGAYLGIDCGSTTTKLALVSENKELLYTYYASNNGDPVEIVRRELGEIYRRTQGLSLIHIYFLKLAVSHDDGVIIAGGNAGAELLAVVGLKIPISRERQDVYKRQAFHLGESRQTDYRPDPEGTLSHRTGTGGV